MAQEVARWHDQEAAAGAVQRAGTDHGEIGLRAALGDFVLNPPDQIVIRRVVLDDDRRMFQLALIDQDIDFIPFDPAAHLVVSRIIRDEFALAVSAFLQMLPMRDQIGFDGVEVGQHVRQIGIPWTQSFDQRRDDESGDALIEFIQLGVNLRRQVAQAPQRFLNLLLKHLFPCADRLDLIRAEALNLVRCERFAVAHGHHDESERRFCQGKISLIGRLRELLEFLLLRIFERLDECAARLSIGFALKSLRNLAQTRGDQIMDVLAEDDASPSGQPQRGRAAHVGEVEDVAPVIGHRLRLCVRA